MMRRVFGLLLVASALLTAPMVSDAFDAPQKRASIDQGVGNATLQRYNHTDQGTRIAPAAWLAALDTVDGTEKFMSADSLRRLGFIFDITTSKEMNPYGWPVGITVSDPKTTGSPPDGAGYLCRKVFGG
jgi:hypothetical protein